MKRSISSEVAARQQTSISMPPIPLRPAEIEHYRRIVSSLPSQHQRSGTVLALAATLAQSLCEIEAASDLIEREGLVVASPHGVKSNPAVSIRDAAMKRAASIAGRLKLTPQADAREAQRAAMFESAVRGGAVLPIAGASEENKPAPDWAAMAGGKSQ